MKPPAAQWEYSCERAGTVGSCLFHKSGSADHSSKQQYCELHLALLLAYCIFFLSLFFFSVKAIG